jgi:hypothetical protein
VNDPSGAEQTSAPDDGRLLTRLGEMFRRADPPPADVLELARRSFGLRTVDAELALLVEDSESADDASGRTRAVAVRGAGLAAEPRQLTFHLDRHGGDALVIAVQVESSGGRRRVTGHLAPRGPARIEVRQPDAPRARAVDVDRLGRFVIDDVPAGPTRLTCHRPDVPDVATEWTVL